MKEDLYWKIQAVTEDPGVYQYFDKSGTIIYIGKAKNLKKRVSSYFVKTHQSNKTENLVKNIRDLKTIVVDSEFEALVLENNLIKKHKPKYNILLRDDKTYPWICIKKERFPRVFFTRKVIKDGSEYYGPFISKKLLFEILEIIKQTFPLRTCNFDLSEEKIDAKKYKVCLEYHIKNCLAPCENLQSEEDYNRSIHEVRKLLKGNISQVIGQLKSEMLELANELEFEKAEEIKKKIIRLQNFQSKSTIVNPKIDDVDVITVINDEKYIYTNFMKVKNGSLIHSYNQELKKKLDENEEEIVQKLIIEYRNRFGEEAKEVLLENDLPLEIPDLKIIVPKIGDKRKLIDLSLKNVKTFRLKTLKTLSVVDPERHSNRKMETMKKELRLSEEPRHIECFDNSNLQGTNPVAACVVFRNGKPSKKEYRKFNIKTVTGPDDFKSMEEVVYRRYKRLLDENLPLPNLVVVDGGKGQLSSGLKSLEKLNLRGKVAIIGIAKRLEELFYPDDPYPLYLDKNSETLKVIQHMRNEAHRFGITFHRDKRSKEALKSELEYIPGIGEKTMVTLMKNFSSVEKIKTAGFNDLASVIGKSKASNIIKYYKTTE